jgi:type IV fimbrial biogenesis protein FimT
MALPSLADMLEKQRLRGSANELRSDLQYARAASIARNERLWVAAATSAQGSCYLLHTGHAGDCHCDAGGGASCGEGGHTLKAVGFPLSGPVQLHPGVAALGYEPSRGFVTPTGELRLVSRHGSEIRAVVGVSGRVRSCTPSAALPGLAPC